MRISISLAPWALYLLLLTPITAHARHEHHPLRNEQAPLDKRARICSRLWQGVIVTMSTDLKDENALHCGLMNQHMKLLVFFTLAISLRVHSVVIPFSYSRDSYLTPSPNWHSEPTSSLWDVESIQQLLARHNISTSGDPSTGTFPPSAVHMQHGHNITLDKLRSRARCLIAEHVAGLQQANQASLSSGDLLLNSNGSVMHQEGHPSIWFHADDLFWMLNTQNLQLYADVAKALQFNRDLVAVADIIAARLRLESEVGQYYGLHLRVEKDWAIAKHTSAHDEEVELAGCLALLRQMDVAKSPLYIASAIFDEESGKVDEETYGKYNSWLMEHVRAGSITNRQEMLLGLLPHGNLATLNSEQRALLDFLVLQRADKVVGFAKSSFSFNLQEYRALASHPRSTTLLVPTIKRGKWFNLTAVISV